MTHLVSLALDIPSGGVKTRALVCYDSTTINRSVMVTIVDRQVCCLRFPAKFLQRTILFI
jgi:hypothetical protein